MNAQAVRYRILSVDDQPDVAATLCAGLRRYGAEVHVVDDCATARSILSNGAFDLVIVDMKMPPGEWGGLTLLSDLRLAGVNTPALVLSGEGSKQQIVEAMRLGATDWVEKSDAPTELGPRCEEIMARSIDCALDAAIENLPSVLSRSLAIFSHNALRDAGWALDGFRALEMILRLASFVGLSSETPRPLAGLNAGLLKKPSMTTWLNVCCEMLDVPFAGRPFQNLARSLLPDSAARQVVRGLIGARNALVHTTRDLAPAECDSLLDVLTGFSHRASTTWHSVVGTPVSMTFDGEAFFVKIRRLAGEGRLPTYETIRSLMPIPDGHVVLASPGVEPVTLNPWLATYVAGSGQSHTLVFDGLRRSDDLGANHSFFKYVGTDIYEVDEARTPAVARIAIDGWLS